MPFFKTYPDIEGDETTIKITRSQYTKDANRIIALITVLIPLVFTTVELPKLVARHDPLALVFPGIGGLIALLYVSQTRHKVITLDLGHGQYEQVLEPALMNRRCRGRMADLSVKSMSGGTYNHVMLVDRSRRWFSVIAVGVSVSVSQELAHRLGDMAHIPVEIV